MNVIASPLALRTIEPFPCQDEVQNAVAPLLKRVFSDGTAKPTIFADQKTPIEQVATACGAK